MLQATRRSGGARPAKVVRVALENAVGVASTMLLAEATMTEINEDLPPPAAPNVPMM
jgi:hypothetical protein